MPSQATIRISDETKCVCRLVARRVFADGSETGSAVSSGFIWRHNDGLYIITNWHCLSGRNPESGDPLGSFSPNKVLVEAKLSQADLQNSERRFLGSFKYELDIEDEDGNSLWIEHPSGPSVDLAAIRLPLREDSTFRLHGINEISYESRWSPSVASDAFIVGFPEGISGALQTPIWKRASIATEPELDFGGNPLFLVDTIGNCGLSGSPVVAVGSGMFSPTPDLSGDTIVGSWKKLVGVYAGRLGKRRIHSQLGRVWKAHLIEELFSEP